MVEAFSCTSPKNFASTECDKAVTYFVKLFIINVTEIVKIGMIKIQSIVVINLCKRIKAIIKIETQERLHASICEAGDIHLTYHKYHLK